MNGDLKDGAPGGLACGRRILMGAAVIMAVAVALGAFGAHGLRHHTDAKGLATWETAVRYQAWHGLGLLILSVAGQMISARMLKIAVVCMLLGIGIFSGTLYVLVLSGIKWLGAITPIGGVLLIAGWIAVAVGAGRRQ